MSIKPRHLFWLVLCGVLSITLYQVYPVVLFQVVEWQKSINGQLAATMRQISQYPHQAGFTLLVVSFLYGVFHAVGPGHGKFILTSYLSLEQTKLPKMLKITWSSAIVQGVVAVALVTVLVVIFTISRQAFNLTLKWVERTSFLIMIGFGAYWLYQASKTFLQKKRKKRPLVIHQIRPQSLVLTSGQNHSENCNCGHKHLPSSQQMAKIQDWKSMWAVIFSIGLRPCTGAVFVLFFAYTLDLYWWGVISAIVMAIGTGLTLTLFACLVLFARYKAVQASQWYFSIKTSRQLVLVLKVCLGIVLMGFGCLLLHSSFIEMNAGLLRR